MDETTWSNIEKRFQRFPRSRASSVQAAEFDSKMSRFHGQIDPDYREFILRYGGGIVGSERIYGLRKSSSLGSLNGSNTAPDITDAFRKRRWPGVENWLIFSVDQGGNPVGFAPDRTVWLSDQTNFPQIVQIASGFEDYLLKWCLMTKTIE